MPTFTNRRAAPLKSLPSQVKSALFRGAWKAGVLDAIKRSRWRRDRLLILCYHGLSLIDEHDWSDLYISPSVFEERLRLLQSLGVRVAPLAQALQELREGRMPGPTVALTFDDGTADFALRAAPLLGQYRLPATVYLTTYYAKHQLPVFDPWSAYLLWKGAGRKAHLGPLGQTVALPSRADHAGRATLHDQLRAACAAQQFSAIEKDAVLRALCDSIDVSYADYCGRRFMHVMNAAEVASLPTDLVDIQLHTHRHRSPIDRAAFHAELALNQRSIADLSGDSSTRTHFCYPSGVYNKALRDNVAAYGLTSATTCDPGLASRSSDSLLLPRFVDTMGVTDATFAAWVTGGAALLPRRRSVGAAGTL
jgi:peptidoglycan/xylan/chitin deacetylase (PgdA/CDA1 family)